MLMLTQAQAPRHRHVRAAAWRRHYALTSSVKTRYVPTLTHTMHPAPLTHATCPAWPTHHHDCYYVMAISQPLDGADGCTRTLVVVPSGVRSGA